MSQKKIILVIYIVNINSTDWLSQSCCRVTVTELLQSDCHRVAAEWLSQCCCRVTVAVLLQSDCHSVAVEWLSQSCCRVTVTVLPLAVQMLWEAFCVINCCDWGQALHSSIYWLADCFFTWIPACHCNGAVLQDTFIKYQIYPNMR
jgi:hypothetical protein